MVVDSEKNTKNANQLLLLEIRDRVEYAFNTLTQGVELNNINIDELKIDKESLEDYKSIGSMKYMAKNLDKKIDYLLENSKSN